ncbi:MAG: F0F1 ATP synthase subunit B [Planctomycetes bacterium]|nr:F0F1 ATP synthase subunit B [Planctomycetota bacterium]
MRWLSNRWWLILAVALPIGINLAGQVSAFGEEPEHPEHAAAGGEHGHGDGEQPGPMTATAKDADLALWTLITFVVFLFVLKKLAWTPLIAGLDKRESSMFDNLAAAESARAKAEKMLAEHAAKLEKVHEEVREILAEAKRDAEHLKAEIIATAQKEAEATRVRSVHDIERARDQALDELFGHMGRVVADATEQVLGRALTGADNERLIEEALSGFAQRRHP